MPNWVLNYCYVQGEKEAVTSFYDRVSTDGLFDFEKVAPMPEDLYHGPLGEEEFAKYGKNNWYDWSLENWGVKWNADNGKRFALIPAGKNQQFIGGFSFYTAWGAPIPIIEKTIACFPQLKFTWLFGEELYGFAGKVESGIKADVAAQVKKSYAMRKKARCALCAHLWSYDGASWVDETNTTII